MAAPQIPLVTLEDYLEFERNAPLKHEYYRGRIIAMAGGKPNHSQISTTIAALLWNALRQTPCRVFGSDARLAAERRSHYTYPDVMVVCGDPVYTDTRRETITNPVLIVEVLSPTTELADRVRKLADYQQIASLREYALVSQFGPRVELYRRQEDGAAWSYHDWRALDATVTLDSVEAALPMAEIYEKIEFEPELD